jgi:hypothetical protein
MGHAGDSSGVPLEGGPRVEGWGYYYDHLEDSFGDVIGGVFIITLTVSFFKN